MSTSIEWTATVNADGSVTPGRTWNPITGCTKVSAGCKHCYAEGVAHRFFGKLYPDGVPTGRHDASGSAPEMRPRRFTDVMTHADRLSLPLTWRKPCNVFVNSMSDLFHEAVPFEFIDSVFAVMALTPHVTYQILTKRPERMREYLAPGERAKVIAVAVRDQSRGMKRPMDIHEATSVIFGLRLSNDIPPTSRWPLPNVWLGVSVENQQTADVRIPTLLQTPSAIRFASYEPALGPIDFKLPSGIQMLVNGKPAGKPARGSDALNALCDLAGTPRPEPHGELDWIIVGGESGHGARPFDIEWARSTVQQCRAAGVACFVKQIGANPLDSRAPITGLASALAATGAFIKDRKGGDPEEWPADLRVREFPAVTR